MGGFAAETYIGSHKDIMHLLVANGKLALRLFVTVGKRLEGPHGLALKD